MTQRSPVTVLILWCVTFGIYPLIWLISTKNELNQKFNAGIPTGWLLILGPLGLYWSYKYWTAVQKVTGVSWILGFLFGPIGAFMAQGKFNETGAGAGGMARAA
jgi:hypothetical protein